MYDAPFPEYVFYGVNYKEPSVAPPAFAGPIARTQIRPGFIDAGAVDRPSWMPAPRITALVESPAPHSMERF